MVIASSDCQLGGGVAKGAREPDGTAPLRWLRVESPSPTCRPPVAACGVVEPDVSAPAPVGACGVVAPDEPPRPVARASASTDAATSNAPPARCAES
jgi:hypothetical protein